jgi:hypothetical protein
MGSLLMYLSFGTPIKIGSNTSMNLPETAANIRKLYYKWLQRARIEMGHERQGSGYRGGAMRISDCGIPDTERFRP